IGNVTRDKYIGYVWHKAPVQSLAEAKTKQLVVGGTSVGGLGIDGAIVLKDIFGYKLKIVSGYKTSNEVKIALERGEVEGTLGNALSSLNQTDWLAKKLVRIIVQHGSSKHRELADVPLLRDLARDDAERQMIDILNVRDEITRPYLAPPGFSPGGGFDLNARVLARHIGRHIPGNPTVAVQNMAGAGSLTAVHYLDLSAPKDGTVLDIFNFGNIGDSRLHPEKIKVDFRKFNWIGSISQDLTVCYVWHAFGVNTMADLKAKPQVHMGLTGMGSSSDTNQRILKSIFGVRVQQVAGYPGSAEQRIAIERGELDGDCGAWSSIPLEWIEGRKIVPVIRSSPSIA